MTYLIYLILFIASISVGFYLKTNYEHRKRQPTRTNIARAIQKFGAMISIPIHWQEEEVEVQLCRFLQLHFAEVSRQYTLSTSTRRGAKERVDIDVGKGRFGIEIKLARLLKKTNERNRLLGQIDLYQTRCYSPQNLLVLIVGESTSAETDYMLELRQIIENKGAGFMYLPAK